MSLANNLRSKPDQYTHMLKIAGLPNDIIGIIEKYVNPPVLIAVIGGMLNSNDKLARNASSSNGEMLTKIDGQYQWIKTPPLSTGRSGAQCGWRHSNTNNKELIMFSGIDNIGQILNTAEILNCDYKSIIENHRKQADGKYSPDSREYFPLDKSSSLLSIRSLLSQLSIFPGQSSSQLPSQLPSQLSSSPPNLPSERSSLPSAQWKSIPCAKRKYGTCGTLSDGSNILIGGRKYDSLQTNRILRPNDDTYITITDSSHSKVQHAAVAAQSKSQIYCTGGSNPLGNIEMYDVIADTWCEAGSMIQPRFSHTSCIIGENLIVSAGGRYWDSVEQYDIRDGKSTLLIKYNNSIYANGIQSVPFEDGILLICGNEAKCRFYDVKANKIVSDRFPALTPRYGSTVTLLTF